MNDLVYKPPINEEIEPIKSTIKVNFCNDIFLNESWLIKNNIKHEENDLESTPLGKCYRIKRKNIRDQSN